MSKFEFAPGPFFAFWVNPGRSIISNATFPTLKGGLKLLQPLIVVWTIIVATFAAVALEQEIKQEKFESEYHKTTVNILFTSSWLYNLNAGWLKPYGITPEQYNVLRILRGSHPRPLMLVEITCRMIDKSSNATRLVEKLRQKTHLKREICENNRRQVDISITDKGLTLLKKIDGEDPAWMERLGKISKTEAKELNRILDKLRE